MKRYRFLIDTMAECECDMAETPHGEYVKYHDHEDAMKAALQQAVLTIRDKEAAEQRGAERERAAMLDWLDVVRIDMEPQDECYTMELIAAAIRRGDHHAHRQTAQEG